MNRDHLARHIFEHAQKYADSRQVRLGPGADFQFKAYADRAADELAKTPDRELDARLRAMDMLFERLIDEMIGASKQIPGYERGVIGEQTLQRALQKLCPIFPFC